MRAKMIVVGIVGGIASGKSLVARELAALGATVLDADRVGHRVLRHPPVARQIRAIWGDGVFDGDGQVDRRALAARVFGATPQAQAERHRLERISHPRIGSYLAQRLNQLRSRSTPLVALDAAILFQSGWDRFCDHILFVDASHQQRRQRVLARGWSAEQWEQRESAQLPLEWQRQRATCVVNNQGTAADTCRQLRWLVWAWGVNRGTQPAASRNRDSKPSCNFAKAGPIHPSHGGQSSDSGDFQEGVLL